MKLGGKGNEMNLLNKKQQIFNLVILRQKERQCTEVTPSRSELRCKMRCQFQSNTSAYCGNHSLRGLLGGAVINFYSSLVCIKAVLCLAVVSTALQKLHKCVTENTTELLQREKNNSGQWLRVHFPSILVLDNVTKKCSEFSNKSTKIAPQPH